MASFGHGGNIKEISRQNGIDYNNIIDFSANINPLGMPVCVKSAIIEGLQQIEKYPDITYFELKNAIADFENINKDHIILGNGAAEVLFNIVRGINPKNSLILAPTFSEYEEAITSVSGSITSYVLKEEKNFEIQEDILNYINEDLNLICICNPNNPTGVVTSKEILEKILIKSKSNDVMLLIDESFLDFIEEDLSMMEYVKDYKNLIIIKSLTKFFALPGIRIGYGICSDETFLEKINKIIPAWNINIFAEIATKECLKDEKYIKTTLEFIRNEKQYVYNELKKIKQIKVYKPSANFILLRTKDKVDLKQNLLKNNILIRSCSNYEGLNENYYRIAIRSRDENTKLMKYIKKNLEK
ncbi:threonine-phosphate decarboxylase CobD [Clostridium saccharobutylicum]|uniref:threonine-phosphate decarboxylase n=1 Tax=Clostridium saccharobutylicum TaxID=169679 RepID=A0A1S8MTA4_CLOSA|nr:threonine-phosphate decarboxylase CobD [Clostridium saccharobutylicum]OOM07400.1 threonine-phosphate decarboxylase [Clostridium saccharobutylicum]